VLSNQESLQLQYALQQRALELGWRPEDIEIIDADLGLTATSASHRAGFQELVAKVTLGQVGIILSVDVMRLSRNCSDWYPCWMSAGTEAVSLPIVMGSMIQDQPMDACCLVSRANSLSSSCTPSGPA
jgi:DNA invertase Pin-like site-specific DNA recombinase